MDFAVFFGYPIIDSIIFWAVYAVGVCVVAWHLGRFLGLIGWYLLFGIGYSVYMVLVVITEPHNRKPFWGIRMLGLPLLPIFAALKEASKTPSTRAYGSDLWRWRPLFQYERRKK